MRTRFSTGSIPTIQQTEPPILIKTDLRISRNRCSGPTRTTPTAIATDFWKKDQWELFDLANDPHELHNLYGLPGHESITAALTAELLRLKKSLRDEDQFANEQIPNGVDGTVATLRGR